MFPETIYGTADSWGNETQYYNEADMEQCIESLIAVGFDESISLGDCQKYKLINVLPNNQAAYEGGWITDGYNRNGRHLIVVFTPSSDGFDQVIFYDPKTDSEEIQEAGINY